MTMLTAQVLLAFIFSMLAAYAMWLGWPWVVGFAIFALFCILATPTKRGGDES
jgi:hypothetical protein